MSSSKSLDMSNKKIIYAKYVKLRDTKIHTFKMPYNVSTLTSDIVQQSVSTNILLSQLAQSVKTHLEGRDQERADSDEETKNFVNIKVRNLIYNGTNKIFEGIKFLC